VSDPELFRHRQAGFAFLITAPNLDEMPGPVGEALRALHTMYQWTRTLQAPAAVERILEATGLLAMTAAASPGGAEAGDLLHAVDRIRQVTEEGATLADAADALVSDLESPEVESVPLEPGRTDVRLMNLHKAKGLGAGISWPIQCKAGRTDLRDAGPARRAGQFRSVRWASTEGRAGEPPAGPTTSSGCLSEAEQRRLPMSPPRGRAICW
jgi:superfamily I DNA/RNA helicase